MKLFDPHIHMYSRTTDDYTAMYQAGLRAVIEPAFWLGQPRTHAGSFDDYFQSITGWEPFRASQFGIRHFAAICVNSKECNDPRLADEVIKLIPRYLEKDNVVAVGEIGYDDLTETETHYFRLQLEMARERSLPVIIHTPHRHKKAGVEASIDLIRKVGIDPSLVVIDHNNEETVELALNSGCWAGHTIYPRSKMDADRMVAIIKRHGTSRIIVNSSADWGVSNPLAVPVTANLALAEGLSPADVEQVFWKNPIELFSRSGAFTPAEMEQEISFDQSVLYHGNSVLRGQVPISRQIPPAKA